MVIFNGSEIPSRYTIADNMIVEITSSKSLNELYDILRKNEDIPEGTTIDIIIRDRGNVILETAEEKEKATFHKHKIGIDSKTYDFDTWENVHELSADEGNTREKIFSDYESFLFGNEKLDFSHPKVDFTKEQVKDTIRKHIALSQKVMPTLLDEKDLTLSELKAMSAEGELIVRYYGVGTIAKDNPLPTRAEIEDLASLTEYEKRLIKKDLIHPLKIINFKKQMQEIRGAGAVITNRDYDYVRWNKDTEVSYNLISEALINKYRDEFQKQYHFVPQVLKEYVLGKHILRGISEGRNIKDTDIEEDVKNFSRPSVSSVLYSYKTMAPDKEGNMKEKTVNVTVATSRNPALIALSSMVNFAEMPQQVTRALATYVAVDNIASLTKANFANWIKEMKNEPVSEIVGAIEAFNEKKFPTFTSGIKPVYLINNARYEQARRDQASYESNYNYRFSDNEIAIRGRHLSVEENGMRIRMLAADDPHQFTTGSETHCCQHWGGAGGTCVYKLTSDPFAANVVIERIKDETVLGQAFVWTDEAQDIFVFDNFEFANDGEIKKYLNLIGNYAANLPYANVQLGMGYTQGMNGVGEANKLNANMPTTLNDHHCYSDYHPTGNYSRARDLKRYNPELDISEMIKYPLRTDNIRVRTAPDEPTKWDLLASKQFAFMLNDCHNTPEERIAIARDFLDNPTKEVQERVYATNPLAILSIDNPDPELQIRMFETNPEIAEQIKNPCFDLQVRILEKDPNALRRIQNPSEELILSALERNGLLLEAIHNPTEAMCLKAIQQDGYSILLVPEHLKTSEVRMEAIKKSPKVVSLLESPTNEEMLEAARRYPESVLLLDNPSVQSQMAAVSRQPDIVLRIKNPDPAVVRVAVEHNPLYIGKYQYQFPELRETAIRANAFAIRDLNNITVAEYELAIAQNPDITRFVTPPVANAVTFEEPSADLDIEFD